MNSPYTFRPADPTQRYPGRGTRNDSAALLRGLQRLPEALRVQGFSSLREGQESIVQHGLMYRDTIGILPTGQGKSACYITPALCHDMRVLIFSPLTALIADQNQKLVRLGLKSGALTGLQSQSINAMVLEAWRSGDLQFMFSAPERIDSPAFAEALHQMRPDMIVIDEAHVVSSWSDNFRKDYKYIGDVVRTLAPRMVLALTATCPPQVEEDIRRVFCLSDAARLRFYPRRKNLILQPRVTSTEDGDIINFAREQMEKGQTLMYCGSILHAETMTGLLQASCIGRRVDLFHGQLKDIEKKAAMDGFMSGHTNLMVCTNAFGMGIDKADVRGVIHYDIPGSIENLSQEIGRAGRDGKESICTTFMRPKSVQLQRFFIATNYADRHETRKVYNFLKAQCAAEKDGVYFATQKDVQKGARVNGVEASLNLLYGERLVQHEVGLNRPKLRIKNATNEPGFQGFMNAIMRNGVMLEGEYHFDMEEVANTLGVSSATVRNRIKLFEKSELVTYTPSARGTKFSIIPDGDVDSIDFTRIEEAKVAATKKLEQVISYCYLRGSDECHSFIEQCLGVHE